MIFNFPFVLGIGLFVSVSVLVSHAHGARKDSEAAEALRNGILLAGLLGLLLAGLLLASLPFLDLFQQPAEVTAAAPGYLFWLALSIIPTIPQLTIKNFSEAKNHPWPTLWIMLASVLLNMLLNYILIFGHLGCPRLGLQGAGLATFLARSVSLAVLWIYLTRSKRLASSRPTRWLRPLNGTVCKQVCKIGLPVSGQLMMEFGSFAMTALLIGQFGSAALAAHQITLSCAAFTFMIPLGMAMAVTIRVGHTLGAGERDRCRKIVGCARFEPDRDGPDCSGIRHLGNGDRRGIHWRSRSHSIDCQPVITCRGLPAV